MNKNKMLTLSFSKREKIDFTTFKEILLSTFPESGDNLSKALYIALTEYFFLNLSDHAFKNELNSAGLFQVFQTNSNFDDTVVRFRVSEPLYEIVHNIAEQYGYSITRCVLSMIGYSICFYRKKPQNIFTGKPLINVLGNKYWMHDTVNTLLQQSLEDYDALVEPFAGGLGLFSIVDFPKKRIINDDDVNKVNLFRAIKYQPEELCSLSLKFDVNPDSFNSYKEEFAKMDCQLNGLNDFDLTIAAYYLYLNLTSYWSSGNTFATKMTDYAYRMALGTIFPLSRRLQKTEIHNCDALDFLQGFYRRKGHFLFEIDPTYLGTNTYDCRTIQNPKKYGTRFGEAEHERLAEILINLNKKGHDFTYHGRIEPRKKSISNKTRSTLSEIELKELIRLNQENWEASCAYFKEETLRMFGDRGFNYLTTPYAGGSTEIIITSRKLPSTAPFVRGCFQ